MVVTLKNTVNSAYNVNAITDDELPSSNKSHRIKNRLLNKNSNNNTNNNVNKNSNNNSNNNNILNNNSNKVNNTNKIPDYNKVSLSELGNNSTNSGENKVVYETSIKSNFSFWNFLSLLMFLIIIGTISAIYYFREKIINYFKSLISSETSKNNTKIMEDIEKMKKDNEDMLKKIDDNMKKEKETSDKNKDEKKEEKEGKKKVKSSKDVKGLNIQPNNIVKEEGYCYIGFEDGQRECAPVNTGDICMSGEVFPRLDQCSVPELRF